MPSAFPWFLCGAIFYILFQVGIFAVILFIQIPHSAIPPCISSVGNQNDVSPIDKCRIGFFRIFQERQKTDLLSYASTLEETY